MRPFLLVGFLIGSWGLRAQDFEDRFLGGDFITYKGTQLKYKDNDPSGQNFSFYGDLKYCQERYDNHVLYPTKAYNFETNVDSMSGRIFSVLDIVDKGGRSIDKGSRLEPPIFVLEDTKTGQVIYFKYDVKYADKFPFLTKGIVLDKERLCTSIERLSDDFTDKVTIQTPLFSGVVQQPMVLYKIIEGQTTTYYLSLRTTGPTVVVDGHEAIILFTDGTKWTRSTEVDVDAGSDGFNYSVFVPLTKEDLTLFQQKQVKKFRLYIFDQDVDSITSEKFMSLVACLIGRT